MESEDRIAPTLLHDLAFLYLELAHGVDDHLDANEQHLIAAKLREWQPNQNPKLIDHVIREAMLTYLDTGRPDKTRLELLVEQLSAALPADLRRDVLTDLDDIARADGRVLAAEDGFIEKIAHAWGIDKSDMWHS